MKRTVLAGMLRPIANVSVAKSAFIRPSPNRISVVSLRIGRRPPWWMPIPRFRRGSTFSTCVRVGFMLDLTYSKGKVGQNTTLTCGRHRSSSDNTCIAFWNTSSTSFFSSAEKDAHESNLVRQDETQFCTINTPSINHKRLVEEDYSAIIIWVTISISSTSVSKL